MVIDVNAHRVLPHCRVQGVAAAAASRFVQGRNTSSIPEADVPEVSSAAALQSLTAKLANRSNAAATQSVSVQAYVFAHLLMCCQLSNSWQANTRKCRVWSH
jgi:hypothetical protein